MNQHAATHKNQNVKSSPSRSSSNPNSDCDVSQPKMLHGVCNDMKYTVSETSNYFLIPSLIVIWLSWYPKTSFYALSM